MVLSNETNALMGILLLIDSLPMFYYLTNIFLQGALINKFFLEHVNLLKKLKYLTVDLLRLSDEYFDEKNPLIS